MRTLSGIKELYDYLMLLTSELKNRGSVELSNAVDHARRCSASNISTEFLGESRIALRRVSMEEKGILNDQEREDLSNILAQLDASFDRR